MFGMKRTRRAGVVAALAVGVTLIAAGCAGGGTGGDGGNDGGDGGDGGRRAVFNASPYPRREVVDVAGEPTVVSVPALGSAPPTAAGSDPVESLHSCR